MTTRIPILGFQSKPDTSGKVWQEPLSLLGTNDAADHLVFRIDEDGTDATQLSTRVGVYGAFMVPKNYASTPAIVIVHQTTKTTGNVVFDMDYQPVAAAESLDPATLSNSQSTGAVAVPGTTNLSKELSITLSATLVADDLVEFFLVRDGGDANDTLAGASLIHGVYFQYTES